MRTAIRASAATLVVLLFLGSALGETNVRIATYNIKYLNDNVRADRLAKLREVIDLLEADIIAL